MVLRWSWCFGHPQRPRQAQLWRVQQDPVMFTSKSGTCSFIYYFQVNRHGPCQFLMGVLEHLRRPVSRWNRLNQFVFEKIFINIYHVNFWYTLLALAVLARVELDKVAEGIQEHHDQLETIFYRLSLKNSKKKTCAMSIFDGHNWYLLYSQWLSLTRCWGCPRVSWSPWVRFNRQVFEKYYKTMCHVKFWWTQLVPFKSICL